MAELALSPDPLRWGILGAAHIARQRVAPVLSAGGGVITAVAARDLPRAEAFARDFAIPAATDDYAALLQRPDVDAVYLPLVTSHHHRWALECARAGKHCLCEKPLVMAAREAWELREAFARSGVRLMEAFMWRHQPWVAWLPRRLKEGAIGELRRVHVAFAFNLDRPDDFRWADELGGGSLWDVGCYCLNIMRLIFDAEPLAVSARSVPVRSGARADRSTVAWLDFGNDRLGTFHSSYVSAYEQMMILHGDAGRMIVRQPFTGMTFPTVVETRSGDKTPGEIREETFDLFDPYAAMVAHFVRAVRDPSFALHPGEDGVPQAAALEALARSATAEGQVVRVEEI